MRMKIWLKLPSVYNNVNVSYIIQWTTECVLKCVLIYKIWIIFCMSERRWENNTICGRLQVIYFNVYLRYYFNVNILWIILYSIRMRRMFIWTLNFNLHLIVYYFLQFFICNFKTVNLKVNMPSVVISFLSKHDTKYTICFQSIIYWRQ